jgi:quercetin dioxygenase-like cupin family protein
MDIFESLHEQLPQSDELQRVVLFGSETGSLGLASVLVRIPPNEQFPLHTHPTSEDCFFALAGSGYVTEPSGRLPIEAPAGVWIPAGHPHGLAAGASGMLEIGFQSPPDHTAAPYSPEGPGIRASSLVAESFAFSLAAPEGPAKWSKAFRNGPPRNHLDAQYAILFPHHELRIDTHESEIAVVIASGEAELTHPHNHKLPAFSAVREDPGGSLTFRATDQPVLLLAAVARAAA